MGIHDYQVSFASTHAQILRRTKSFIGSVQTASSRRGQSGDTARGSPDPCVAHLFLSYPIFCSRTHVSKREHSPQHSFHDYSTWRVYEGGVAGETGASAGPGKGRAADSTDGMAHMGFTPWKAPSRGSRGSCPPSTPPDLSALPMYPYTTCSHLK